MNNKVIISGIVGFVVGGFVGAFTMYKLDKRRMYDELTAILNDELDRNDERWQTKLNEALSNDYISDDKKEDSSKRVAKNKSVAQGKTRREAEYTDYTSYYQNKPSLEEIADRYENVSVLDEESMHPSTIEELNINNKETIEPDISIKNAPKLITFEDFDVNFPQFDKDTLYYYDGNDTLVTESEEVVDNESLVVGDCLDKYDFRNSEEDVIYVRSYPMRTDYEIRKIRSVFDGI